MPENYLSRAQLESLHQTIVRDSSFSCPACRAEQHNKGLIAWCDNGHVYRINESDPRYHET